MLEFTRGDDVQLDTAVTAADRTTPYDLSTVQSITFTARTKYGGPKVFEKTLDDDISITDAAGGLITILLRPADTLSLPSHTSRIPYDIQIIDQSGRIITIENGLLRVNPDVT